MALLESRYKAAARTEIERAIRQLEERGKGAAIANEDAAAVSGKVDLSQNIGLISEVQAREYKARIQTAELDRRKLERIETRDIVNDFENPRERAARYQDLDQYNTEIRREREMNTVEQRYTPHERSKSGDEGERTRTG